MDISPKEAPFLVGMKGRNISLIRKCSGMIIHIRGPTVFMSKQRPSAKPDLAARMVFSACNGGILRWFVTQAATNTGYPLEKIHIYEAIAHDHACTLKLLRARCGHMCLMLIPDTVPSSSSRENLAEARKLLLDALSSAHEPFTILTRKDVVSAAETH